MVVNLNSDTKDLAEKYDELSESQFDNGCILIDKLGLKLGDSVLDIGSGTGRLGRHVGNIIGNSGQYIGVDPMAERLKIAREKNEHPNAVFRVGVAEDLGFVADNSIDIAYLNWVFHWVLDRKTALQEIVRVLKPGGKVGITIPSKELSDVIGLNQVINSVLTSAPYNRVVRMEDGVLKQGNMTTSDLIVLLADSGLKVKDVQVKLGRRFFRSGLDAIDFLEASFFGNFLNHVPESIRQQAKADIEAGFEKYKTPDGLQFDYYTIYSIAQKG